LIAAPARLLACTSDRRSALRTRISSSVYLAFGILFIHRLRYRHILVYRRYPKIEGKLSKSDKSVSDKFTQAIQAFS
jgi:hypothetical protein